MLFTALLMPTPIALTQVNLKRLLQTLPTSRLQFSPHTVGVVIVGYTDRLYVLNARKGQTLAVEPELMGARASVSVLDRRGEELVRLDSNDTGRTFSYTLPYSGDYYVLAYGDPTYHRYHFTLTVFTEGM
ncbi:hypothetical protein NBE99_07065 [Thermosynechococcus sp. HN-54]|uniref:hypothetical protein n=1 Tax=Thermosynechococcus sp. HN-54 TaxID=2933959 RepID=UPI00202CC0EC|nr:hypothetical protein [Thermosynechococcus sp. HN-54]URR34414.1 hypothetical protein NBE99_07065 [Thermosynechococcus sp. HN-54]